MKKESHELVKNAEKHTALKPQDKLTIYREARKQYAYLDISLFSGKSKKKSIEK